MYLTKSCVPLHQYPLALLHDLIMTRGQTTAQHGYLTCMFTSCLRCWSSWDTASEKVHSESWQCFGFCRPLLAVMVHLVSLPPPADAPNHWSAVWLNTLPRWVQPTKHCTEGEVNQTSVIHVMIFSFLLSA